MNEAMQDRLGPSAGLEPTKAPESPVHSEVLRMRENMGVLGSSIDVLCARLDVVLASSVPKENKSDPRRLGASPMVEELIERNDQAEYMIARLRDIIARLTI